MQFKAKDEIVLRKYTQLYNLKFELGLLGNDPYGVPYTYLRDEILRLRKQLAQTKAGSKSKLIWLTINLAPVSVACADDWVKKLLATLKKYTNSKMFSSYIYTIEQRQSTFDPSQNFVGQHVHMLLVRHSTYCYSQVIRNSRNTWRYWCDVENAQVFNSHKCPLEFVQDKLDYCLGKKTDSGKPEKVLIDKIWRRHHKINDIYESEDKYFSSNYKI